MDELRAAGVLVAGGTDNVRDVFNPVGRCDPLETAALLVTAGHQSVEDAAAMVGCHARRVLSLPEAGPVAGAAAELVALPAADVGDAVATAPPDRWVWHQGRMVARTGLTTETAF
jgi:cytosine deaminase